MNISDKKIAMEGMLDEDNPQQSGNEALCGRHPDSLAGEGCGAKGNGAGSGQDAAGGMSRIEAGQGALAETTGQQCGGDLRPDPKTGPGGELVPLGMASGEVPGSIFKRIKRYVKNVGTAIFRPKDIFCPQVISMAGGKLQYTLSEDVRLARAEAYAAGERSGKRQSAKLERYVEGDGSVESGTALAIFERGEKKGFNNGFTHGRNERAENSEEVLGGFDDLEEFYNRKPHEVFSRLGGKLLKVHDWDDEISLYQRRYGKEKTKEYLLELVDDLLDEKRTMPALPSGSPEIETIENET